MATKIAPDFDYSDPAEQLAIFYEAYVTVAKYGKSYAIGNRTFTRANLADLAKEIATLERLIGRKSNGLAFNNARLMRKPN